MENSPVGHHITNVCLHTANAILLFLLLLYMTGYAGRSAIVAFLFALHPAHVESVAWISERKDVLCAFFFLCTLLAYAWYVRRPSWKRYVGMIFCYACALMSKPMAVTLPFVLLLLDMWPLRRITLSTESSPQWFPSLAKLCIEKWPLFLMAVISSVLTFFAQRAGGMVIELQTLPLWERLSNAAISYCRYMRILVWPDPLTAYYYYDSNNIRVLAAVLSVIALILVTALCWRHPQDETLLSRRLAVVSGNTRAGDRHRAGGRSGFGRALFLYSLHRYFLRRSLVGYRCSCQLPKDQGRNSTAGDRDPCGVRCKDRCAGKGMEEFRNALPPHTRD